MSSPVPPQTNGSSHPSRSGNQSVSSSRSERTRSRTPAVESTVTRLLVSIKQLLESLTKWSNASASEDDVSDVYVRLGNDFNAAVAAFAAYNIDMSELLSVPDDLRSVLEDCLSEEPSTATLDKYLPKVRAIITNLLQGLRAKQSAFRQISSSSKHRSDASGHSRTDSRGEPSRQSRASSKRDTRDDPVSRRNTQASVASSASTSSRRRAPDGPGPGEREELFVGGFSPELSQPIPSRPTATPPSNTNSLPERPPSSTRNRAPPAPTPPPLPSSPPVPPSPAKSPPPPIEHVSSPPQNHRNSQPPPVPASVKRYSLVDAPASSSPPAPPTVIVESASSTSAIGAPSTPPSEGSPIPPSDDPYAASTLAALKQADALERRASKRFSTYNISKIAGVPSVARRGEPHANRRSIVAGGGGALTPGELAALTEADDDTSKASPRKRERTKSQSRRGPPTLQDISEETPTPPVPALPAPASMPAPPAPAPAPALGGGPMTVFMQVGREVKKARLEPGSGVSFAALRVMFVERFAYNPGQGNFPAIYIRDPSSGVSYELEDTDEIKDGCLLSLNVEPLDQIKEHIDAQMSALTQELRELKKTVGDARRASLVMMPASSAPPVYDEPAPTPRPSDVQLRSAARRLSRFVSDHGPTSPLQQQSTGDTIQPQGTGGTIQPQMTGASTNSFLSPQFTGMSVLSEGTGRIVADLRTQFDEVQNLRRDLGIMRQLYGDFARQTKDALGGLRAQTARVREMASARVPGARAYIDEGKSRLDERSQNVLTKMEELQDTVEQVKDDVLKRQVSPKQGVLRTIREGLAEVDAELASLREHIETVRPMWKKTWEAELQGVVEEQQFLQHQEGFVADLREDFAATREVFGHVEKFIAIRGQAATRGGRAGGAGRVFRPPPPDEGHSGLSTVMLEIQGAAVDPERRMKAIAASQKNRERELRARGDEFESELRGGQAKLNKTGGAEEAERIRQRKNEMTLRAMFNGGGGGGGGGTGPASPTSPAPS